jgi:excisionase family DNA binding protein
MQTHTTPDTPEDYCGTTYAAKLLGLSVGTIQTLVEKNELQAWKTQGGHRRISMPSIRDYQKKHNMLMSPGESREYRLRVLLVEDDPVTRDMVRDFCNRCEMPVDCTAMSSGLEALIDMASIQPDVLIADLNMPGVDGFELLRTLKHSTQFQRMTCLVISSLVTGGHRGPRRLARGHDLHGQACEFAVVQRFLHCILLQIQFLAQFSTVNLTGFS